MSNDLINHHEASIKRISSQALVVHACNPSVTCQFEVLLAGVEGPCLHMPENWLVRQLSDEPKLVYEIGFIREKGKAIARAVQGHLDTGGLLLR
jgi:hypothetical protein